MLLGALMMVKNEEISIAATINSLRGYIDVIILYDTGSTDNTVSIAQETCKKNKQTLHLKKVNHFNSFPESRNESLAFAETIDVKYLLMVDAGDEFKTQMAPLDMHHMIRKIPSQYRFGVVKQIWLEDNNESDHSDIRFTKNKSNCRYHLDYPVHEKFIMDEDAEQPIYFHDQFILFQQRDLYGKSTEKRFYSDIEILSKAKPLPRNLFFLAQTYSNIKDYANSLIYCTKAFDILKYEVPGFDNVPISVLTTRILDCAIRCWSPISEIKEYFQRAVQYDRDGIAPYILFFDYCINTNHVSYAVPYLEIVAEKQMGSFNVSKNLYTYDRWRLIGTICLMANTKLELGRMAVKKAIEARNLESDKMILMRYDIPHKPAGIKNGGDNMTLNMTLHTLGDGWATRTV